VSHFLEKKKTPLMAQNQKTTTSAFQLKQSICHHARAVMLTVLPLQTLPTLVLGLATLISVWSGPNWRRYGPSSFLLQNFHCPYLFAHSAHHRLSRVLVSLSSGCPSSSFAPCRGCLLNVVYLPGVRISTWLWVQRQRRRQVAARALGEIEGMLLAEEDQLRADSSAPPPTCTDSNAAVAGDTCHCAVCTHCHPHSMLAPTSPAESVGSEEATASTDATADVTEAAEEPGMQGSGTDP
jgi:hypothetical protein